MWLREWMHDLIDGKIQPPITINLDAIPAIDYSWEEMINIWNQTGYLYFKSDDSSVKAFGYVSFDQYCDFKQHKTPDIQLITHQ
jgi:hypothetical protein